jgi:mRNA interferase YafQ
MRKIHYTNQFKRDCRRTARGRHHMDLDRRLAYACSLLAANMLLPLNYRDHHLKQSGFQKHRECHLKPDLLLIYAKPDEHSLLLIRMGSHGELF